MRVALKGQGAGWVIDNIVNDYKKFSRHEIVGLNDNPDVFWCVNLFSFPQVIHRIPYGCKSCIQLHHINEKQIEEYNFNSFNQADRCMVPNKITEEQASRFIKIPIVRIPYWLLSSMTSARDENKISSLTSQISDGEILIGSFVKDGNGKRGDSPKLIKGPDILIETLEKLSSKIKIKVVLGGHARKYVINNLEKLGIPYVYLEKYNDITTLYDCLDWYLSTSRVEGGPQSILEASYRNVKILSTKVGIAPEILHTDCLCNTSDDFVNKIMNGIDQREYNRGIVVEQFLPERIIPIIDDFFQSFR